MGGKPDLGSFALRPASWIAARLKTLSGLGLVIAALFMAAALTPSLIPRSPALQGFLCGLSLTAGYALGGLMRLIWQTLELPRFSESAQRLLLQGAGLLATGLVLASLWLSLGWQNEIRQWMGMAPEQSGRLIVVLAIALAVATVLLLLSRLFLVVAHLVEGRAKRFLSRPLAWMLGVGSAAFLFWSIGNGVLLTRGLTLMDSAYAAVDAVIQTDIAPPADRAKTGSAASLIGWQGIGHEGRNTVAAWPNAAEITGLSGVPAQEPIRVYVGLNSASSPEARAELALAELLRVGAFERSLLVIATPTGTGWLDQAGMAPLEILHGGDVASVSVQYSYLPSWLSLLLAPEYGKVTARAVFRQVYGHWTSLPQDQRPRLFLFGLSLGALNSMLSSDLYEVIDDPFDGALWVGPPFASKVWRDAVTGRDPESPIWRPVFRESRTLRFANRGTGFLGPDEPSQNWGPLRIGFLQYPGDPITFFDPESVLRAPEWLGEPRTPDLPPGLRWYPIVTTLQGILDLVTATQVPPGHGHVYASADYLRAWTDLTEPVGWTPDTLARIEAVLSERGL
ncbi:alpha/beta hydrolase [Pseudotabrizicola alkalilacus]|nr:alpha/beta-hydrolase family protein [Pseudotabrizicola alkalilacus]